MKRLLDGQLWPLAVGGLLMLIAAVVNACTLLVPNLLTFPAILAAWIGALLVMAGLPSQGGGIGSSILLTFFAGMLLAPLYGVGCLGAGCVKMHMALGAWIGCAFPAEKGAKLTIAATFVGGLLTAVGMLAQAAFSSGASEDNWLLFPVQVTMSLGAIGVLVATPLIPGNEPDDVAFASHATPDACDWQSVLNKTRS